MGNGHGPRKDFHPAVNSHVARNVLRVSHETGEHDLGRNGEEITRRKDLRLDGSLYVGPAHFPVLVQCLLKGSAGGGPV